MSSQSSGVENLHRPKIAAYPMRSRYESSRSGLSTILESFVAIAISREIGDRGGEAKSWFNLGFTYYKLKRISEAKEAYLQSRELFQALGLAGYVQKCDDEIRQLETRKYPLIVAFFAGTKDPICAKITISAV